MAEPPPYFERQHLQQCAVHTVNNLLNGAEPRCTAEELDGICYALTPQATQRFYETNPHKSALGTGNYDVSVLEVALRQRSVELQWWDARKPAAEMLATPGTEAAVVNVRRPRMFPLPDGRHWLALRRVGGAWTLLDSQEEGPRTLGGGSHADAAAYLQGLLALQGTQLFRASPAAGGAAAGGAGGSGAPAGLDGGGGWLDSVMAPETQENVAWGLGMLFNPFGVQAEAAVEADAEAEAEAVAKAEAEAEAAAAEADAAAEGSNESRSGLSRTDIRSPSKAAGRSPAATAGGLDLSNSLDTVGGSPARAPFEKRFDYAAAPPKTWRASLSPAESNRVLDLGEPGEGGAAGGAGERDEYWSGMRVQELERSFEAEDAGEEEAAAEGVEAPADVEVQRESATLNTTATASLSASGLRKSVGSPGEQVILGGRKQAVSFAAVSSSGSLEASSSSRRSYATDLSALEPALLDEQPPAVLQPALLAWQRTSAEKQRVDDAVLLATSSLELSEAPSPEKSAPESPAAVAPRPSRQEVISEQKELDELMLVLGALLEHDEAGIRMKQEEAAAKAQAEADAAAAKVKAEADAAVVKAKAEADAKAADDKAKVDAAAAAAAATAAATTAAGLPAATVAVTATVAAPAGAASPTPGETEHEAKIAAYQALQTVKLKHNPAVMQQWVPWLTQCLAQWTKLAMTTTSTQQCSTAFALLLQQCLDPNIALFLFAKIGFERKGGGANSAATNKVAVEAMESDAGGCDARRRFALAKVILGANRLAPGALQAVDGCLHDQCPYLGPVAIPIRMDAAEKRQKMKMKDAGETVEEYLTRMQAHVLLQGCIMSENGADGASALWTWLARTINFGLLNATARVKPGGAAKEVDFTFTPKAVFTMLRIAGFRLKQFFGDQHCHKLRQSIDKELRKCYGIVKDTTVHSETRGDLRSLIDLIDQKGGKDWLRPPTDAKGDRQDLLAA